MTPGTGAWAVALELVSHPRPAMRCEVYPSPVAMLRAERRAQGGPARPTDHVVLVALRRAGRPLSIAELVEVTGRSWPACRRAVAALERTGDVERVAWSERAHGWGAVPLCATALWRGGLPISLGRPWPWLAWCRSWCGYGSGSAPLGVCLDDGRDVEVSS